MNQSHISHLDVDVDNHNTHSNTVTDIATSILIEDAITYVQEKPSEKDEEFDENGQVLGTKEKPSEKDEEFDENGQVLGTKSAITNSSVQQQQQCLATVRQFGTDINEGLLQSPMTHSWSQPGAQEYQVRGRNYMEDSIKVKSEEQTFQTRGVDLFSTREFGPSNIGRHTGILGGKLRDKPTFIVNFRFPWGVLVFYYEIPTRYLPILYQKNVPSKTTADSFINLDDFLDQHNTPHDKAMYDFIMGDDTYRNSKLKLIPKVVEGNLIARGLVKGKPVIIGKKLPVSYFYEPADPSTGMAEYWEVAMDTGSSSATAKKIVGICKKYMRSLAVDIGLVVEGNANSALPERIITSTRIHHFDVERSPLLWLD